MARKILVVADDAGQRRAVRGVLEPLGTVMEASTGKEALRLVASDKPELLLLDVVMTEMDGLDIMRAARFLEPDLPIVMLGPEHVLETARRARDIGPSAYVRKPFDPEGLRDEIRRLFMKSAPMTRP